MPCPALAKASGMMSTAVMVGEITASDWAKRDGSPRALIRSPWVFVRAGASVVPALMVIATLLLCLVSNGPASAGE